MSQSQSQSQPRQQRRSGAATPSSRPRASYETGESSGTGSLPDAPLSTDRAIDGTRDGSPTPSSPLERRRNKRRTENKSGGSFLVHSAIARDHNSGSPHAAPQVANPRTRAGGTNEALQHHSTTRHGTRHHQHNELVPSSSPPTSPRASPDHASEDATHNQPSPEYTAPEHDASPTAAKVDAAQIVNMALTLSDARRVASRRTVSRPDPPRLAPLPGVPSGAGGSLRQHLQQQRKTSRNISPQPGESPRPRLTAGARTNSGLPASFEVPHESQYRYQFSNSTLIRAQKAKEHMELMTQYWRLLEALPPLKPDSRRLLTPNPSASPFDRLVSRSGTINMAVESRPYNPLQYIRNRKVRARERKVIDGEAQGFSNVDSVRAWVDEIYRRRTSTPGGSATEPFLLPPFPSAEDPEALISPDLARKGTQRAPRPRVDWFQEPRDMIADSYWLEKENHKQLIEDRRWRRIFPSVAEPLSTPSRQDDSAEETLAMVTPAETLEDLAEATSKESESAPKADNVLVPSTTKDRAKQTLHGIKTLHHHRGGSGASHHDSRLVRRDSGSDLSQTDNEGGNHLTKKTRHGRSGTITSGATDVLQKQMLEMIAKEARQKELDEVREAVAENGEMPAPKTPERVGMARSPERTGDSRKPTAYASDSDYNPVAPRGRQEIRPTYQRGRQSLEVPEDHHRRSLDEDSSAPTSPDLRSSRRLSTVPTFGTDMSSSLSRPVSPVRHSLTKVKQRLRDKNRGDQREEQRGHDADEAYTLEPGSPPSNVGSPNARHPIQLVKGSPMVPADHDDVHRINSSPRLKHDDQAGGIRGIFKGPRIDTVLRGGVSKLGDMIWKKDGSADSPVEAETANDSDSDTAKGKIHSPQTLSRRESTLERDSRQDSKHVLDSMPSFTQWADHHRRPSLGESRHTKRPSVSRNHSRQKSSRFELLKPPRIEVRPNSPSASPESVKGARVAESDASESESRRSSVPDGVRGADQRLNTAIGGQASSDKASSVGRHWSITDRNPSMDGTRLSRRDVARMRVLILSSGIKAMEISRRAQELQKPLCDNNNNSNNNNVMSTANSPQHTNIIGVPWQDVSRLVPDHSELAGQEIRTCESFPHAARALGAAVQASGQRWQSSADHFTNQTSALMHRRIWAVRSRVADDLSGRARRAADEADAASRELALDQPLKVKHVIDIMEKLLRKRRRRFRWVRRALWLTVEWLLVGIMWYVWFVVMILRIFTGLGRGVVGAERWLLWL